MHAVRFVLMFLAAHTAILINVAGQLNVLLSSRVLALSHKGFRSALVIVHGPSSPQLQQRIIKATSEYASAVRTECRHGPSCTVHDRAGHGLQRRYLGKPAFMEVPTMAAVTDFVLDAIQSSVRETCDGMLEQVCCYLLARRLNLPACC